MRAVVVEGPQHFGIQEVPVPTPPPGWARVRVTAAALCSTDLEVLSGGIPCKYPLIPGHEWCGVVDTVSAQKEKDNDWVGQRVVASNDVCCLVCPACRSGHWRNCPQFGEIGFAHDGAFAEYLLVPLYALRALPDQVDDTQACLLEPMGVALGTLHKARAALGDTLLIIGAGSIGLHVLAVAKAMGLRRITVMERSGNRLALAARMGASHTIATAKEDAEEVLRSIYPQGPDVIVESSGAQSALQMALTIAPKSGRIALAGYGSGRQFSLRVDDIHVKNLLVHGAGNNWNTLDTCLSLAEDGIVDTRCLATHPMALRSFAHAVRMARERGPGFVKAVFQFEG